MAVVVGPATDIEAQPSKLGAYHVTWFENDTAIDSEWLTREEFEDMKPWFEANGWKFEAKYVQRAHLGPEALARLIQEYQVKEAYYAWCEFNHFTPTLGGALYLVHGENEKSLAYQLFKHGKWTIFCMMWPAIFAAVLHGREQKALTILTGEG